MKSGISVQAARAVQVSWVVVLSSEIRFSMDRNIFLYDFELAYALIRI